MERGGFNHTANSKGENLDVNFNLGRFSGVFIEYETPGI